METLNINLVEKHAFTSWMVQVALISLQIIGTIDMLEQVRERIQLII
jgi:hypothetical protein